MSKKDFLLKIFILYGLALLIAFFHQYVHGDYRITGLFIVLYLIGEWYMRTYILRVSNIKRPFMSLILGILLFILSFFVEKLFLYMIVITFLLIYIEYREYKENEKKLK